jgi:hypothetical protein
MKMVNVKAMPGSIPAHNSGTIMEKIRKYRKPNGANQLKIIFLNIVINILMTNKFYNLNF